MNEPKICIVTIRLPLSNAEVEKLAADMTAKGGQFTIWGEPIKLGEGHFQIYGAQVGAWVPCDIELTPGKIVALFKPKNGDAKTLCEDFFDKLKHRFKSRKVEGFYGEEKL